MWKIKVLYYLIFLYIILPWIHFDVTLLSINLSGTSYVNIRNYLLFPFVVALFVVDIRKFKLISFGLIVWMIVAYLNLYLSSREQSQLFSTNLFFGADIFNLLFITVIYFNKHLISKFFNHDKKYEINKIFDVFSWIVLVNAILTICKIDIYFPWARGLDGYSRGVWFGSNLIYSMSLAISFIYLFYKKSPIVSKLIKLIIVFWAMFYTDVDTSIFGLLIALIFTNVRIIQKRILVAILMFVGIYFLYNIYEFAELGKLNSVITRIAMLFLYFDLLFSDIFHLLFGYAAGGFDSILGNNFQYLCEDLYSNYLEKWDLIGGGQFFEAVERASSNILLSQPEYRIIMPHFGIFNLIINIGFVLTSLIMIPIIKALNIDLKLNKSISKYYSIIVFLIVFQFFHTFFFVPLVFTLSILLKSKENFHAY